MGVTVRVVKDTKGAGLALLERRLRSLDYTVLIGVPKGVTEADGTPLALVAAANEFGVPSKGIPERSFLRAGIHHGRAIFRRIAAHSLRSIVAGKMTEAAALGRLGLAGVSAVQTEIISGTFAPNAPETIRRKGSDKPLVDTAALRQGITFVIDRGQGGAGVVR